MQLSYQRDKASWLEVGWKYASVTKTTKVLSSENRMANFLVQGNNPRDERERELFC